MICGVGSSVVALPPGRLALSSWAGGPRCVLGVAPQGCAGPSSNLLPRSRRSGSRGPVSYTHLTLPTICSV
eukprot:10778078-Prorocentrum_lima.AAC.1